MPNLAASIRDKLLRVSKQENVAFQDLLNRFGAEQFLARLSISSYTDKFIFKGGALLTYLLDTDRQTRDLDFSIRQISNQMDDVKRIIQEVLAIQLEDALVWGKLEAAVLNHPQLAYPGVRMKCNFYLGVAKGQVQMDLAIGDEVEARKISLERIRYNEMPLLDSDFEVWGYPPETIFSEKLQTAISKGGQNTRMKDYYDLFKLSQSPLLDDQRLARSIQKTFAHRGTQLLTILDFGSEDVARLQVYWSGFVTKWKMSNVPKEITGVMEVVNQRLKQIFSSP